MKISNEKAVRIKINVDCDTGSLVRPLREVTKARAPGAYNA
jgi:hypothetical protein